MQLSMSLSMTLRGPQKFLFAYIQINCSGVVVVWERGNCVQSCKTCSSCRDTITWLISTLHLCLNVSNPYKWNRRPSLYPPMATRWWCSPFSTFHFPHLSLFSSFYPFTSLLLSQPFLSTSYIFKGSSEMPFWHWWAPPPTDLCGSICPDVGDPLVSSTSLWPDQV